MADSRPHVHYRSRKLIVDHPNIDLCESAKAAPDPRVEAAQHALQEPKLPEIRPQQSPFDESERSPSPPYSPREESMKPDRIDEMAIQYIETKVDPGKISR